jgi:hypothetical protein
MLLDILDSMILHNRVAVALAGDDRQGHTVHWSAASENLNVFPLKMLMTELRRLLAVTCNDDLICPTLLTAINHRLEKHKLGLVSQAHVDQLIVHCILMYNNDAILQRLTWQELTPTLEETFQAEHLCDIGHYVRNILLNTVHVEDELSSMLRLSMPYIKHNRLS